MSRREVLGKFLAGGMSAILPAFVKATIRDDMADTACFAVMNPSSNDLVVEWNAHRVRPVASLTKLMTGLIIFDFMGNDKYDFDSSSLVTIPNEIKNVGPWLIRFGEGEGGIGLKEGQEFKAEKLLIAMGARSEAYSSIALAIHSVGLADYKNTLSEEGKLKHFINWMNIRASDLGMNNTFFKNVTGEHAEGHVSSAADMALLMSHIQKTHPKLAAHTFGLKEFDLSPISDEHRHSSGFMHWYPENAKWAKTGHVKRAGHCLATYFERDGQPLIGIVLAEESDESRNKVMGKILNLGYQRLEQKIAARPTP